MTEELAPREIVRVTGTEIEQWGEREILSEMIERVMWLHPEASKVGRAGVFAACQLAILTGASPVPGHNELHMWANGNNPPTVMLGINFDRRRANEVAGGIMYVPGFEPRPMTKDERITYGIADNERAAICKGYRIDRFDKYLPNISATFNIQLLTQMISSTGHAICAKNEPMKKGRSRQWTAEKRAEADLLRKLVPNLERPDETYRITQAREHLLNLDRLIPNGDLTPEEAQEYQTALFGSNDVHVVNGESKPVTPVHWNDIRNSEDAVYLAMKREVFETEAEAESEWSDLLKQVSPGSFEDMISPWQSLCQNILWEKDNPQSLEEWLAGGPEIEEIAKKAVKEKFRLNIGDVYNDLSKKFKDHSGGWRNVPAEDAWAFLSQPKQDTLPHPWLGQMWPKILHQRVAESNMQGEITKKQIGKLLVLFGEKCADLSNDERHTVTEEIFGKSSLNDFTKAEASVLIDAMEAAGETLADEMQAVLDVVPY